MEREANLARSRRDFHNYFWPRGLIAMLLWANLGAGSGRFPRPKFADLSVCLRSNKALQLTRQTNGEFRVLVSKRYTSLNPATLFGRATGLNSWVVGAVALKTTE